MFRIGITFKNSDEDMLVENFISKDKCEEFLLEVMENREVKKYIIVNKENIQERWSEIF